jgi:hypothetical protein
MTEDTGGGAAAAASGMLGNLSTGEKLIGGGAAWLFVINYVIGSRIAWDYGASTTASMLALGILAAIYFNPRGGDAAWKGLYKTILVVAAWGIAVLAGLDVLNGLINDNFAGSSGRFYEVTYYVAAAVMAFGAYQMSQAD